MSYTRLQAATEEPEANGKTEANDGKEAAPPKDDSTQAVEPAMDAAAAKGPKGEEAPAAPTEPLPETPIVLVIGKHSAGA